MRRGMILAALSAIVALLFCGVLTLQKGEAGQTLPTASQAPAKPGYEVIYERPLALLTSIDVTLAGGEHYRVNSSMAFDEAGRLLGVYSTLGQPLTVDGRDDFALDATAYQMLLLAAQGLPATAHYPGLDSDACGLMQPHAQVTVHYADGQQIKLLVGSKTASGLSCYLKVNDSDETYLVPYDFYDVITRPLKEQHRLPGSVHYTVTDAAQLAKVEPSGERMMVSRGNESGRVLKWQVTSPVVHDAADAVVSRFVEGLCAVHAERYVDTVYDASGLAAYGLDKPTRYVAAFSDGVIRDLHVGSDAGEGRVYARMDATGDVYEISRTQLAFAQVAALDQMLDRFVDLVPINRVNQVKVTVGGKTWVLTQRWADETAAMADAWSIGGQSTTQQDFSSVYAALVGLQFDKTGDTKAQGEPLMVIDFMLRDSQHRETIVYPHDAYYDAVITPGGASLLLRHTRIETIIQMMEVYPYETD